MMNKREKDKLFSLLKTLVSTLCGTKEGEAKVSKTTQGGSVVGDIQVSSITTSTISESDAIRVATVEMDTATEVDITVTLHDGSTFIHKSLGSPWSLALELYQSSIESIVVEEQSNTLTRASINYMSL